MAYHAACFILPHPVSLFSRGTLAHPISIAFDFHWMAFWLQQHIGLRVLISFSIASRCRAKWAKRKKKNVAKQSRTVQKENRKKQCKGNSCFCSLPMPSNAICGWPKSQLLEMKTWIRICCCNLPNTLSLSLSFSLVPSLFLSLFMPFPSTPSFSRSICHFAWAVQKWKPL